MLVAGGVTVRYPGSDKVSLAGVSAEVRPGRLLAVVGPNGSGKTTLLRALLGAVRLDRGTVDLDGRPIATWPARDRARRIGVVSQREEYPFAWRVEEVVTFGRYPWLGPLEPPGARDRQVITTAMARCDVTRFARRRIDTLSGGEWQRVRIARALAQEAGLLLLDEPTASLDLGHEMDLFELIRNLVGDGLGAAVVTHHINVAARFADDLLLLMDGCSEAHGPPDQVLEAARLSRVFEWPVRMGRAPEGVPQIVAERRPRP